MSLNITVVSNSFKSIFTRISSSNFFKLLHQDTILCIISSIDVSLSLNRWKVSFQELLAINVLFMTTKSSYWILSRSFTYVYNSCLTFTFSSCVFRFFLSKVHMNFWGKILKHLVINDCRFCEHHTSHNSLLARLGQQFLIAFVTRFLAKGKKNVFLCKARIFLLPSLPLLPVFPLSTSALLWHNSEKGPFWLRMFLRQETDAEMQELQAKCSGKILLRKR